MRLLIKHVLLQLYYIHFVHVLLLHWLTFSSIGHRWSNHYPVKLSLQSFWYAPITKHSKQVSTSTIPLLSYFRYLPQSSIFPSLLIIEPRYQNKSLCEISSTSILIVVLALCTSPVKLQFIYFVTYFKAFGF